MKKNCGILMMIATLSFVLMGCDKDDGAVKKVYRGTYDCGSYSSTGKPLTSANILLDKNSIAPSSSELGFEKLTGIVTKGGESGKNVSGKYEWDYVYLGSTKIGVVAKQKRCVIGLGKISARSISFMLFEYDEKIVIDDIKFEHEFYGCKD